MRFLAEPSCGDIHPQLEALCIHKESSVYTEPIACIHRAERGSNERYSIYIARSAAVGAVFTCDFLLLKLSSSAALLQGLQG
jgi:hypothetical protein